MKTLQNIFRNVLTTLLLLVAIHATAQEKESRNKLKDIDLSDPWMIGKFELAPLIDLQYHPKLKTDSVDFSVTAVEIGFAFVHGESDFTAGRSLFSGSTAWKYVAPFISGQLNFASFKDSTVIKSGRNVKDHYRPFHLNLGVTAGFGDSDSFPVGLSGTLAVSTDFENLYVRTGIAIDLMQISLGIGSYTRITANGSDPSSMSGAFINARYMIWNR
jgi:hypothetical protein